jgi:NADPH:quinone reductase-like Zn-dependent oxidoreductase
MKAIIQTKYSSIDAFELKEIEKPTPRDDEVLVEVYASSVNYNNLAFMRGKPFLVRMIGGGLLKPKYRIPGGDIAGRICAVGKNAKLFQPGDEVFGDLCGCGFGAYAEYVSVPEDVLVQKPSNISFEEAATVPQAALVALQGLRNEGQIRPGQKVLIAGSSGGNGSFAVQLAKHFGTEVTAVCSTGNVEMVRSIGADYVIDYTREDFCQNGQNYDLILATAGYRSIFDYNKALCPQGVYVMAGGSMAQVFQAMLIGPSISKKDGKKLGNVMHSISQKDLVFMKELIEAGKVKPVVDRTYPLSEAVEALRYYGEGHAKGKVAITVKDMHSIPWDSTL